MKSAPGKFASSPIPQDTGMTIAHLIPKKDSFETREEVCHPNTKYLWLKEMLAEPTENS